jgi:uncharacterized DUF497 family protein
MRFEWDEAKRLSNIARHLIDFIDAQAAFDGRAYVELPSAYVGERRAVRTALLEGTFVTVVWTARVGGVIRIISVRRARDGEERRYRQLHG